MASKFCDGSEDEERSSSPTQHMARSFAFGSNSNGSNQEQKATTKGRAGRAVARAGAVRLGMPQSLVTADRQMSTSICRAFSLRREMLLEDLLSLPVGTRVYGEIKMPTTVPGVVAALEDGSCVIRWDDGYSTIPLGNVREYDEYIAAHTELHSSAARLLKREKRTSRMG